MEVEKIIFKNSYIEIQTDKGRFTALAKYFDKELSIKIYTNTIVEHSQRFKFAHVFNGINTNDMNVFRALTRAVREYLWDNVSYYSVSFVGNPDDEIDLPEFNDKCFISI